MSAGGEAVAWQERAAGGVESNWFACSREEYERLKDSRLYEVRALYDTPPAAVPVEALEGLLKAAKRMVHAVGGGARCEAREHLRVELDRLTTIIKERSNG